MPPNEDFNTSPDSSLPVRACVVAPTFDNARTLTGVIEAVLATGLPVIVVNDGATDGTAGVLADFGDRIVVVTHAKNQGKAAALQSGFRHATQLGYTHAATIDTDAQHDPADLPTLVALTEANPSALVLGVRDVATRGYPPVNRLGRWAANTLVRWESGQRVADSQCGLRVYPLDVLGRFRVRSGRYGYETEVLTRCAWAGVPFVQANVRCVYEVDGGRVSHFRPWADSVRLGALHVPLLTTAAVRWLNPAAAWRAARTSPHERRRLAAAVSVGVLIANLPLYGLQTVLSVAAAKKLRLQPLAVIAGSHASTPPLGPVLIALAIGVGHWLLHGEILSTADIDPRRIGYIECLRRVALEWTIGGVVCGVVLAAATYGVGLLVLRMSAKEAEPSAPLSPVLTGEG
ncbi:MAG TPA: DUF2062 domain-containing protein [Tepidisphaeraceae bacterium]